MMNAFEILYQGALLAGVQYDEDVEEAYREDELRNAMRSATRKHRRIVAEALRPEGFWRDVGQGVEQWVEPR